MESKAKKSSKKAIAAIASCGVLFFLVLNIYLNASIHLGQAIKNQTMPVSFKKHESNDLKDDVQDKNGFRKIDVLMSTIKRLEERTQMLEEHVAALTKSSADTIELLLDIDRKLDDVGLSMSRGRSSESQAISLHNNKYLSGDEGPAVDPSEALETTEPSQPAHTLESPSKKPTSGQPTSGQPNPGKTQAASVEILGNTNVTTNIMKTTNSTTSFIDSTSDAVLSSPRSDAKSNFSYELGNGTRITISGDATHTFFFCNQRSDRTGAAVLDYLVAHAFAFRNGAVFGGACGNVGEQEPFRSRQEDHKQMLDYLGLLDTEIPILLKCPSFGSSSNSSRKTIKIEGYMRRQGFGAFTTEWTNHMRKSMRKELIRPGDQKLAQSSQQVIVVHIRRGDVEPCDVYTESRYLTNQYYIDMIRNYASSSPSTRVIIHSQNWSFEPWTDFDALSSLTKVNSNGTEESENQEVTVELKLDAPIRDVWFDILVRADVFIMSKSAFSQVAAVLMDAESTQVVCGAPPHSCHSRWIRPSDEQMRDEKMRFETMKNEACFNATFDARQMPWSQRVERMGEQHLIET